MKTDSAASYPSGHTTTAAVLAVALIVIAATYASRSAALVLGSLYVLAVAASRVYLADHYPLDVIGAYSAPSPPRSSSPASPPCHPSSHTCGGSNQPAPASTTTGRQSES